MQRYTTFVASKSDVFRVLPGRVNGVTAHTFQLRWARPIFTVQIRRAVIYGAGLHVSIDVLHNT